MMRITCVAAAAVMVCSANAQVVVPPNADPSALQQRRLDEDQRRQELERMELKPVAKPLQQTAPVDVAPAVAGELKITVRKLVFSPASEILAQSDLTAKAAEFEGKRVGIGELRQLVEQINAMYRAKGVVTARAILPPQDLSEGTVTVRLVEGRIGAIRVNGNATTRENYVLSRVDAAPGKLVDVPALQESLVRFNRTNDVKLRAELKPGADFGSTALEIGVLEPERHVFRVGLDNLGSETTGRQRLAVGYSNRSVLGMRDALGLGLTSSSGLKSASVDYGFPVTASGGRVTLALSRDETKLKYGALASLGITGTSNAGSLSLRQPLLVRDTYQTDLLFSVRKRDVKNLISGIPLSATRTDDVQLGVDHVASDERGQWQAGLSFFSGKSTTAGVGTRYTVSRGSLRRTQALAEGWALRGSLSVQHTGSDALPTGEYFFLGGEGSVRGYPVGQFAGDRGTVLSLELQHPLGSTDSFGANGFFFVDAGRVSLVRPPNSQLPASESLKSVGWGANLFVGQNVSARVTLAYALTKLPEDPKRFTVRFQLNSQF